MLVSRCTSQKLIVGVPFSIASTELGLTYYLIIVLWLGSDGNARRSANLKKRGFQFARIISAQTPDAAIAQYIQDKKEIKSVHDP